MSETHAVDVRNKAQDLTLRITDILKKKYPLHDIPFGANEIVWLLADALAKEAERVRQLTLENAARIGHRTAFEFLGMHEDQRTYTWHEVEDALTKGTEAIRALAEKAGKS